jgi:hypothetical protein
VRSATCWPWATRTSKVHETPSPAAQARGSVASGRGCCRWPVPTSPACALATWICEPAGLLALTTLTGYTSRVRRCWPKCPAGGGRGGRPWPRNNDGRLSITHARGMGGIRRPAALHRAGRRAAALPD